jgi:dihydroflavonol-4-reductase
VKTLDEHPEQRGGKGFVDVRDVAVAHVLAMETPGASGRYLCGAETLSMRDVVAIAREAGYGSHKLPRIALDHPIGDVLVRLASYLQPVGVGSYLRTHLGAVPRFDNTKIRRELGLRFRDVRTSIVETLADLERWGHLGERSSRA